MTMLSQQDLMQFEDDDLSDLSDDGFDDETLRATILNTMPTNSNQAGDAEWRNNLEVGQKIDALDNVQMWYTATIVEKEGDEVRVRFDGFSERWDETLPIISSRLAPFKTKALGGKNTPRSNVQIKIAGELGGFTYFKA